MDEILKRVREIISNNTKCEISIKKEANGNVFVEEKITDLFKMKNK